MQPSQAVRRELLRVSHSSLLSPGVTTVKQVSVPLTGLEYDRVICTLPFTFKGDPKRKASRILLIGME